MHWDSLQVSFYFVTPKRQFKKYKRFIYNSFDPLSPFILLVVPVKSVETQNYQPGGLLNKWHKGVVH